MRCEVCNNEVSKLYPYEIKSIIKQICNNCWVETKTKENTKRILHERKLKNHIKRDDWVLNDWVRHLKKIHNISSIKINDSLTNLKLAFIAQNINITELPEILNFNSGGLNTILIGFCQDLDAKLHHIPYAMGNCCDNYADKKEGCGFCKIYFPACAFDFQPNKLYWYKQKIRLEKKENDLEKQKRLTGWMD